MPFQPDVLYDFTTNAGARIILMPVLFVIAGGLYFAFYRNLPNDYDRKPSKEIFALGAVIYILVATSFSATVIYDYFHLKSVYQAKTFKIVEGKVKNMTHSKADSFEIDSVSFSASATDGMFSKVKEGMALKIYYLPTDRKVLRIETLNTQAMTGSM